MKKCKITLAPRAKQKFFYLAPDAEVLYFLSAGLKPKAAHLMLKSCPEIEIVSLSHDQWIEVEWNGCQNIFEDNDTFKSNFVRIVKASKLSMSEESDSLVSLHFGWLLGDQLKFVTHKSSGMNVKMLTEEDEQFNFRELFQDNETPEEVINSSKQTVFS